MPASPPPQARNGFGVAALVLALVGLVFTLVPITGFIALILGIIAIVFGLVGWGRARRGIATNRKMNHFGTGIGVITAVLGIVGMVMFFNAMSEFGRDMERLGPTSEYGQGQPQSSQPTGEVGYTITVDGEVVADVLT